MCGSSAVHGCHLVLKSIPVLYPGRASLRRSRRCAVRCYHSHVTSPQKSSLPSGLRTVFLDRDGILNEKMPEGQYVTRWEDFHVLPGVPEALRKLKDAGLRVVVVSNQRGIARGFFLASDLDGIHNAFERLLGRAGAHIDAFFVCPHDHGQCNCRKPLPGLFEQAVAKFPDITAATSVMIGDSLSDIEFGRNLGMKTIYIDGDPERDRRGADEAGELTDLRFGSLAEAVEALLGQ